MSADEAVRKPAYERAREMFKTYKKPYANEFKVGKGSTAYVYEDLCIGCTQCLDSCAVDAIVMIGRVVTLRDRQYTSYKSRILQDACVGCRKCAVDCPVHAIDMIDKEVGWEDRAESYKSQRKRKEEREKDEGEEARKRSAEWLAAAGGTAAVAPAAEAAPAIESPTVAEPPAAAAPEVIDDRPLLTDIEHNWPHYDVNTCISCSACAEACPTGSVTMKLFGEKEYPVWELTKCTLQAACATACPTGSITMEAGRQRTDGKHVLT